MVELLLSKELNELRKFSADLAWFQRNYPRLKRKYKGEFVAVRAKELVDHDKDATALLKRMKKKYGNISSLVIEHISERKFEYVL